eukprot:4470742-Amphidinium_carterae.1
MFDDVIRKLLALCPGNPALKRKMAFNSLSLSLDSGHKCFTKNSSLANNTLRMSASSSPKAHSCSPSSPSEFRAKAASTAALKAQDKTNPGN